MRKKLFFTDFGDYLDLTNGKSWNEIQRENDAHHYRRRQSELEFREKQMHSSKLQLFGELINFLISLRK